MRGLGIEELDEAESRRWDWSRQIAPCGRRCPPRVIRAGTVEITPPRPIRSGAAAS